MKWYEIIVNTTSEGTELIADAFFSIGCAGGVKIIDKKDITDVMNSQVLWDYIDEELLQQSEVAKVSGFVSEDELKTKLDELKNYIKEYNYPSGEINIAEIDDESWYDSWKRYYSPIEIGNYVIVPKWINYKNDKNLIKILIDPGMAFGTGEHESTKLCLSLMSELNFKNKGVIDVGTGSGILGIGATLSGAKSCYMCDIDSIAIKATQENVELNKIGDKVTIELADLLTKENKKADIVLANLTAGILQRLSVDLPKYIKDEGILICSGIIHERKNEVINAFVNAGFTLLKEISMGDWNGLKFQF